MTDRGQLADLLATAELTLQRLRSGEYPPFPMVEAVPPGRMTLFRQERD